MKTITISAHYSECFSADLIVDGKTVGEYHDYVPDWFPNPEEEHFGDNVQLEIDIETGRILNWKKPTDAQLDETFKAEEGEEE